MSATIAVTISDAAHNQLTATQKRMTQLRRENNPGASKVNQADALDWMLKHAPLPIRCDSEGVD
jgi:hypothetical protein